MSIIGQVDSLWRYPEVVQAHNGTAGVYAAILAEGSLRKGDAVALLDQAS